MPVLVHSSDLHLSADAVGADPLWLLRRVLETALHARADALLLAGDVFDHNRQPLWLLERAARLLDDAGLAVVVLPGNHDPLTPTPRTGTGAWRTPRTCTCWASPTRSCACRISVWRSGAGLTWTTAT